MGAVFEDITATIGYTPLVRINKLGSSNAEILMKLESKNPCGSIKDRIALYMIEDAEENGFINKDTVIVEATSGNTGIGLAFICAAKGYKLILVMPESMSIERQKILRIFGASLVLTDAAKGMTGAVQKANQIMAENNNSFMPGQFNNKANPEAHRQTTAREIWTDTDGNVDILVSGVGTGGTLTGCGEFLKEKNPDIKIIAVEPETSAVLSGEKPGTHRIQGIGAGFIPEVLNTALIDEIIKVKDIDAVETARKLVSIEGILTGISAGANLWAAIQVSARPENAGKTIVTFACDTGERYISTEMYDGY